MRYRALRRLPSYRCSTVAPGSWRRKQEDPGREPLLTEPARCSRPRGLRSSRPTRETGGRGPLPFSPCSGCCSWRRGLRPGAGLRRRPAIPPRPRCSAPPCSRSSRLPRSNGRTGNWERSAALASPAAFARPGSPGRPVRTPKRLPAWPAFPGRAAPRLVNRTGSGRCPGRPAKRSPPTRNSAPPRATRSWPAAPPTTGGPSRCARDPPCGRRARRAPCTSSSSATKKPAPRPSP